MDRDSLIFCVGALVATLGLSALIYPMAALPADVVARAASPQPAEELGEVELGGGFGTVPVIELMGYYVENPPAPVTQGAVAAPQIRFGGC